MKNIIKNINLILILFLILSFALTSSCFATSVSVENSTNKVEKGKEITVKVKFDDAIVTGDFKLKYNASNFTFIESTTDNLHTKDYPNYEYVSAVYANLEGKCTSELEFKFKAVKQSSDSIFEVTDLTIMTERVGEYNIDNISGDTKSPTVEVIVVDQNGNNGDNSNGNNNSGNNESNNSGNNSNGDDGNNNNGNNGNGDKGNNSGNNGNSGNNSNNNGNNANGTSGKINTTGDKTIANKILPHTGLKIFILVFALALLVVGVIFGKRFKYLNKILPILLMVVALSAYENNSVQAYTQTIKIYKTEKKMDGKDVYSIMLNALDTQKTVTQEEIKESLRNVKQITIEKNGQTKEIEDKDLVGTGYNIAFNDDSQAKILLYGDCNGDGKINSTDIYYEIQHMLGNSQIEGLYFEAANLANKDEEANSINENDINKLIQYILGTLEDEFVDVIPEENHDLSEYIDIRFENDEDEKLEENATTKFSVIIGDQIEEADFKINKIKDNQTITYINQKINENKECQLTIEKNVSYEITLSISKSDKVTKTITAKINMIPYTETEDGVNEVKDITDKYEETDSEIENEIDNSNKELQENINSIGRDLDQKLSTYKENKETALRNAGQNRDNNITQANTLANTKIQDIQSNSSLSQQEKDAKIIQINQELSQTVKDINNQYDIAVQRINEEYESDCRNANQKYEMDLESMKQYYQSKIVDLEEDKERNKQSYEQKMEELSLIVVVQKLK